jgi:hypothetical protein
LWHLEFNKSARRISFDLVEFSGNHQISTLPHYPFSFSLGYLSTTVFVTPLLIRHTLFRTNESLCSYMEEKVRDFILCLGVFS